MYWLKSVNYIWLFTTCEYDWMAFNSTKSNVDERQWHLCLVWTLIWPSICFFNQSECDYLFHLKSIIIHILQRKKKKKFSTHTYNYSCNTRCINHHICQHYSFEFKALWEIETKSRFPNWITGDGHVQRWN